MLEMSWEKKEVHDNWSKRGEKSVCFRSRNRTSMYLQRSKSQGIELNIKWQFITTKMGKKWNGWNNCGLLVSEKKKGGEQ